MEQQRKELLIKKLSLFIDDMTPYDRLEIFMDKDGELRYESRIVNKGML